MQNQANRVFVYFRKNLFIFFIEYRALLHKVTTPQPVRWSYQSFKNPHLERYLFHRIGTGR